MGKLRRIGYCCRRDPFSDRKSNRCTYYNMDTHLCRIYDKRPNYCRAFPSSPRDLLMYPNCTYRFVEA